LETKIEKKKDLIRGWKILFRYLLERRKEVITLSILGIFSGLTNGSVPYIVGKFFDALISPNLLIFIGSFTVTIWIVLGMWVSVQITANSVDWFISIKRRRMGTYMHAEYLARATSTVLHLPVSLFKEEKIGEIISKIQRSSNALSTIIEQVIIDLTPQLLSVFIGVGIAFIINPILAGILLLGVLLYIVTLINIVPPIVKMQKEGNKSWNDAFGLMGDAISNFQTVKQSSAEEYESKQLWNGFVNTAAHKWNKIEKIWTGINFYQRIIVVATQLSIFVLSVVFIGKGMLTVGGLIALNGYAMLVFGPFAILARNWQIIQNGLVTIEQTDDILNLEQERYVGASKKDNPRTVLGNIEFKNVSFRYGVDDKLTLNNLSFEVKSGESVALVGESGVGKSTTIELLSGYYYPTKGEILIDGHSIHDIGLKSLRRSIAVVPQEPVLFNDTIRANIQYGKVNSTEKEIEDATKKANADEFIKRFPERYKQVVGERGIKLSVGQKQRIAIARAILRNPKILILDEPTSALDAKTEQYISESLEKLMKGRTTFIIAHRLSTVRRADKILVFDKGRIVEEGKHHELLKIKNGIYRRLYEYQIGLHS